MNLSWCVCAVWPPPNSRHRVTITPAKLNKAKQALPTGRGKTLAQKHQLMTWAQILKRALGIEIETFSNAVVRGYSEHRQIGRKADFHSDVSNLHPLVI
jgi:hypothetical protein